MRQTGRLLTDDARPLIPRSASVAGNRQSPTQRFLATSMMGDEIGDILRMIQVDQQQFAAQGLRDMSDQFVTRQATEEEVRQWHERR
jgi:hypothetical protein